VKIAFVVGDDLTENPRARLQARALAIAGHRVTVYGVLSPSTEAEDEDARVIYVRVPLSGWRAKGGWTRDPVRLARWYERLRPVAETAATRERPDAIHAVGLDAAAPAQDVALALGVPFVFDVAGGAYVDRLDGTIGRGAQGPRREARAAAIALLRRRGNALERRIRRRRLDAVIAESSALADHLERRHGGPTPRVVRSCPPRADVKRSDAMRRRVGADSKARLLVLLGPLDRASGIETAVRALKLLDERCVLVVTGGVPRLAAWERLADALGVSGRLKFVPPAPETETARLAASADVALVPTEPIDAVAKTSIPARFFASLAAGLPVVAADVSDIGEIVRRTAAGVLYAARSPQDPAALAEGVHTLLSDASLLKTCAESARRAADEELSWESESLRLIDLYDEIEQMR